MAPALPLLALPVPIDEKRGLPPDAPQPAPKRLMTRTSYDEIIEEAIKKFGPLIYVCSSTEPKTFTYDFWGIDSTGSRGWIKLFFRAQLNSLGNTSEKRSQLLSFRVYDTYGMIQNIPDLFKNNTPPMVAIPCGGSVSEVRSRIVEVIQGWLDFARRYAT